jgi:Tannase and feruloyl esterase
MRPPALLASTLLLVVPALAQSADSRCADLEHLTLDQARVLSADVVAPGTFVAPPRPTGPNEQIPLYKQLPAFCRVKVQATPSTDSNIQIEVWLPLEAADWNHRFQGQGNGGFAGEIDYEALARFVASGYATAGTDTGHFADGIDASWALHHPEKVTDFGWRGIHEMTVQGKAVVAAYYGGPAAHSYFASCSDGGREALMEAQRFPIDYDGIVAGAPAYPWTVLFSSAALAMQTLLSNDASYIPAGKVPLLQHAVLAQCDKLDSLPGDAKDKIVDDPRACHFNPAKLTCKSRDSDRCFTAAQLKALTTLMRAQKIDDDTTIPPVVPAGGEDDPNGWPNWITGKERGKAAMAEFGTSYFANMVYSDPHWDFRTFDPVAGLAAARERTGQALDATNPDLSAFKNRGGKLILYHGWADAAISALYTIQYYEALQQGLGKDATAEFVRFYLMPGVKHCAMGPGPDSIGQFGLPGLKDSNASNNVILALRDWVEQGKAPDTITATKYGALPNHHADPKKIEMTRPLCPYPQQAHYKGKGSIKEASSFICQ